MNLRGSSPRSMSLPDACGRCCFRRSTRTRKKSGRGWIRASWWNGSSPMACRCGWGCNCIRLCGTRPCAAFKSFLELFAVNPDFFPVSALDVDVEFADHLVQIFDFSGRKNARVDAVLGETRVDFLGHDGEQP